MKFLLRFLEPVYGSFVSFERAHEVAKFGTVGVIGLTVNLSVSYVLNNFMWYLWASMIAFVCTWMTSFTLQKTWTFNSRSMERVHIQASLSISIALCNLVLNTALMYFAVSILGFFYLYAQAAVTLCIAAESYMMYKYVIFRAPRASEVQN